MSEFELGDAVISVRKNEIVVDGKTKRIKPKAMAVLEQLVRAAGDVVTKEELLEAIWPNMSVSDTVVTEAIHEVRRALDDSAKSPRYIQTIPRRGYRTIEKVSVSANASAITRPRLAVLSFTSLSDQPEDQYFCEGICEELISRLGRFAGIDVLGRMSVLQSRDIGIELTELAGRMGASHFVTGTLRRHGLRVRVLAHLIEAASGRHIWSETIDRELVDLLEVQDEIARQIRSAIEPHLSPARDLDMRSRHAPDPEAFREFSKGRFLWHQDNANPARAMTHYESAMEIDPQFAAPYAGMVECFNTLGVFHLAPHQAVRDASLANAEQALLLDPESPEVLFAFGYSQFYMRWNWVAAETALRRCISINPNHALAHAFLSLLCCPLDRRAEALAHSDRATDLEPFSPLTWMLRALQFRYFEEFDACHEAVDQGLEFRVDDVGLKWLKADCLVRLGRESAGVRAVEALEASTTAAPLFTACAAFLYRELRLAEGAERVCERLQSQGGEAAEAFVASLAAMAMEDNDLAVTLLEQAERDHDATLWVVSCDPYFRELRNDPRCRAIIQRLGLPTERSA
jgi:TolB-like protein